MHSTAEAFSERVEREYDLRVEVTEFPEGTKTAADAADAVGCEVAQIVKSIVMRAGNESVIVLTSGENRVSAGKLAALRGVDADAVEPASPETVRAETGWSIGGVPPFAHDGDPPILLDPALTQFETVWAAAGTPEAVFPIAPERLRRLSGASEADVVE